jgi:monoamine oxidase
MNRLPEYDIAIAGGGISGIYTAWRLLTADLAPSTQLAAWAKARPNGKLRVAVFEGSQRIGGRLLSAKPPGMPHVIVEIGGMRYVSSQTLVRSLIENKLKLPRHEQVVDQPQNLAYLRGARLRARDLTNPDRLPYDLTAAEGEWLRTGQDPSGLIGWAITQILPDVQTLRGAALEAYLEDATIDGTPLFQHGFWNLIARALSFEGYQLSRTTVGYDSLGANANAVDMTMEYFNFTPGVKYYLLDGGYDMVPWTLEQQARAAGGEIELGAWLDSFDATRLDDGSDGISLHFKSGRNEKSCSARALVLAMPRRAIELLRPSGPVLDPQRAPKFQQMLQAVEPIALYKMFVCYPFPWWETVGVTQGRSLTDIPIRQCYYWSVEGRQSSADPRNTNAALMNYNDVSNVEFWGGLRHLALGPNDARMTAEPSYGPVRRRASAPHAGKPFARQPMPHAQPHAASDDYDRRLRANWDAHQAPASMVAEMHRQLMQLHDLRYAPEPLEAAFMDWSDDPYGGGVHFWNPGHKSWRVLHDMTQPVEDLPCYVCGEAWSTNQTWVEGALQTSEIVLQQRFCLKPPTWVSDE